jgi:hypothetical protein
LLGLNSSAHLGSASAFSSVSSAGLADPGQRPPAHVGRHVDRAFHARCLADLTSTGRINRAAVAPGGAIELAHDAAIRMTTGKHR